MDSIPTDNAFQARARLLQSLWREERGLPVGDHRGRAFGSRLAMPFAKETLTNRAEQRQALRAARTWLTKAIELANQGEAGAVAAMMALLMGMRCTEIITRHVRDLDDGGKLLWITQSKTDAGLRQLRVPALLQPYLLAVAKDKKPTDRLFGHHWRDWPRIWVERICEKAGVMKVSAHGMRGLHSTLAIEAGSTAHVVAASLGHESFATTLHSYAAPSALPAARQRTVLNVLQGGK